MSHYQIHLPEQKAYPMGSSLELESVRDVLRISPKSTTDDIRSKTYLTREKVMEALRALASEKVLARVKNKYYLLES
jgi:hypothetical protein